MMNITISVSNNPSPCFMYSLRDRPLSVFQAAKLGHSDLIPFNIPFLTHLLMEKHDRCSLNSRESSVGLYQEICAHTLSLGRKGAFSAVLKTAQARLRVLDMRKYREIRNIKN